MMMGSSKQLSSLSNLVDFLSNPEAAKKVLDDHKQAIADHQQAAQEHKDAKEASETVLADLEVKKNELDKRHLELVDFHRALQAQESHLNKLKQELFLAQSKLKEDQSDHVTWVADSRSEAKDIIEEATVKAAKILKDQQDVANRITSEAAKKSQEVEKSKLFVQDEIKHLSKYKDELKQREINVANREKVLADFAARFGK